MSEKQEYNFDFTVESLTSAEVSALRGSIVTWCADRECAVKGADYTVDMESEDAFADRVYGEKREHDFYFTVNATDADAEALLDYIIAWVEEHGTYMGGGFSPVEADNGEKDAGSVQNRE